MDNKELVLVTGAKRYNFVNDKTGEIVKGTNVFYTSLGSSDDDDVIGSVLNKTNFPYEKYEELEKNFKFPALAELSLEISFSGNRPQLKISDLSFKKHVPISTNLG